MLWKFFFIFLLLLTSCGPRSIEDYREEGETITQEIVETLKAINNREELVARAPELTLLYGQLVDLMIEAREYREKHPEIKSVAMTKKNYVLNERFKSELNRIYRLDEGRDIMEKCQEQALLRLDTFEQRLQKQATRKRKG